jgi:hypothetical protein
MAAKTDGRWAKDNLLGRLRKLGAAYAIASGGERGVGRLSLDALLGLIAKARSDLAQGVFAPPAKGRANTTRAADEALL